MYLVVLPEQEGGGLVDSHGHKFNKTAVEAAVARRRALVSMEQLP
jgi:hypothetical protein